MPGPPRQSSAMVRYLRAPSHTSRFLLQFDLPGVGLAGTPSLSGKYADSAELIPCTRSTWTDACVMRQHHMLNDFQPILRLVQTVSPWALLCCTQDRADKAAQRLQKFRTFILCVSVNPRKQPTVSVCFLVCTWVLGQSVAPGSISHVYPCREPKIWIALLQWQTLEIYNVRPCSCNTIEKGLSVSDCSRFWVPWILGVFDRTTLLQRAPQKGVLCTQETSLHNHRL
jgi:hypothetical protein